jgi:arabinan endo-1,5-alpha-L-arabinosidase
MRKNLLAIILVFFNVAILKTVAQENLYIYRSTGSLLNFKLADIDSLTFGTNNTQLIIHKTDASIASILVSGIDSIKIFEIPTIPYNPPTYWDDYYLQGISAWTSRTSWNLANIHDPTVARFGDYFYMYQTDASYGNVTSGRGHYLGHRSKDLVNWSIVGFPMAQTPPTWIKDSLNAIRGRMGLAPISSPIYLYWAPVVRNIGGKLRMYYSVVIDNYIKTGLPNTTANFDNSWTERAFIGLMESTDPANNVWVDKGYVISSVSDRVTGTEPWYRASTSDWSGYFKWNAIDPTYIVTPEGEHWLIYGSWHSGIPAVKLNPETGKPYQLNTLADYGTRVARRTNSDTNRWQAQEGPEIIYNPKTNYYYLFLAYDELSVRYNTRVCRSRSITGPFLGYNGANITLGADCFPIITHPYKFNNHSGWVGFSHCAVFQDTVSGQWYYVSQARLPENTNGNAYSNAIMMGHVRKILWTDDGWPVVLPERYANVPQTIITDSDLVGTWEHITLNYVAGVQQTSTTLTLNANYSATGALSGIWSFNTYTQTLTIGSQKLKVSRELDWEANPRKPTIVYAGLNSSGRSLWGKKVN